MPIVLVLAAFALPVLLGLGACRDPTQDGSRARAGSPQGDFAIHGFSVVSEGDGAPLLALRADEMRHRRRRTSEGLFVYQNLTELELSNAVLEIDARRGRSEAEVELGSLIDGLLGRVAQTAGVSDPEFLAQTDIHSSILTRVLFDGLSIAIRLSEGLPLSIVADRARANSDFRSLVFEGATQVIDTDGRELRARKAIWWRRPDGLYLPGGYTSGGERYRDEAFFVIGPEGKLSRSASVPRVEVRDEIDELDQLIYSKVVVEGLGGLLGLPLGD